MSAPRIDPISFTASYRLAADQIRRAIELGIYLPGERLPPSRELANQLGISVATLREAVRGLIDERLVEMRRGPKGGLVVLPQPAQGASRRKATAKFVREITELLDYRDAVETHAARLAARRRTEADLDILQAAFDEMSAAVALPKVEDRAPRFTRADSQFHTGIARAAQNAFLVTAVEETRVRMFIALGAALRSLFRDAHKGHAEVLRAIRQQQPDAAARAMQRHLQTTRQDVGVVLRADLG